MAKLDEQESCRIGGRNTLIRDEQVVLWWLGQAGFALRFGHAYLLIDPYLSDFLARKYAATEFPHLRMMPPPIRADEVSALGWVLCTHRHSDHMDPETLPVLARGNPQCRFLMPRAEIDHALRIGLRRESSTTIDDGQTVDLGSGITVEAVAAAHEAFELNAAGEHHFLGYLMRFGDLTIYHSGDCVPYEGLEDRLAGKRIDLALMPINGRDAYRRNRNIPGNFTFDEAVSLCDRVGIPLMIGHHFGMFEFNTVDPEEISRQTETLQATVRSYLPAVNRAYVVSPAQDG